ncbi:MULTISPECIES: hypothetical protein [Actinosynnema]|uniref:hypothetical protein n=1 Tax=Actinosynnema TaxID=40566 RepID=UPI0020A5D0D8|nr:hypothetical protein [Actinosynnema pretiosum]MCP2097438.1 hypothetical protein [Actinosynnema pretiosum]
MPVAGNADLAMAVRVLGLRVDGVTADDPRAIDAACPGMTALLATWRARRLS